VRLDTLATVAEHPAGRMRLSGRVCGVDACELVADRDEILVGSALDCDLVIPDPLIPPRAFRLHRRKCHAGTEGDCRCRWALESLGGARVCVNGGLTRRESLADGDLVSIGCHELEFHTRAADTRNFRTNRNVSDICRRLVADRTAPAGFLETTPTRGYLRRRRLAVRAVAALAALVALCFLVAPRRETFESAPVPLEITIADLDTSAAAVRPLTAVERRRFDAAEPAPAAADLADAPPALAELAAVPVTMQPDVPPGEPAPLDRPAIDVADLPPVPVPAAAAPPPARQPVTLAAVPTARRRIDRPAAVADAPQALAAYAPAAVVAAANAARPVPANLSVPLAAPPSDSLVADRSVALAQLDKAAASPVAFETIQGLRVPVARIAAQLEELAVAAPEAAKPVVDGTVTEAEMEASWKSGRFKRHAAGNPPPDADPPTQCFVSKVEVGGQPCLYISFVCTDPDLDKLQARAAQGDMMALLGDDAVEVFLDVDNDRVNYHQVIVNARGAFWTAYYPKPLLDGGMPQPWSCNPAVKTTINAAAGQWTCEIMLPFASLGGVPAPGSRWSVNFCRNFRGQGQDWQLQTWFAVFDGKRNFHHPSRFGVFQW
jgi:hypothetical protein